MKLYHATHSDCVPQILREGLYGDGLDPVHLSENECIGQFIYTLGEFEPGGMYEFEHGHWDVVVTFEVDDAYLDLALLDGERAEKFVPDGDDHHMYWGVIPPDALSIVGVYRGE